MKRRDYFVDPERVFALVAELESWRGTPFRQRSRVRGAAGGVDCANFIAGVFFNVGAIDAAVSVPPYDINHAEHSDESQLRAWFASPMVRARVRLVDEQEPPLSADMVFPIVGRCEHHLGLQIGGIVWHVARPSGVCTMATASLKLARSRYRLMEA